MKKALAQSFLHDQMAHTISASLCFYAAHFSDVAAGLQEGGPWPSTEPSALTGITTLLGILEDLQPRVIL